MVGFHLGFPFLRAGWIGVDIFLVISGFLMQKIYSEYKGENPVRNFYLRRLRRLLPAAFFAEFILGVLSFAFLLPGERLTLFRELLSVHFQFANVYYWMGDQYFETGALRPFLNFWSIALEIQFYLIFPFLFKLFTKHLKYFAFLAIVSLSLFVFLTQFSPNTVFFFLPFRIWEFMLGSLAFELSQKWKIGNVKWGTALFYANVIQFFVLGLVELYSPEQLLLQISIVFGIAFSLCAGVGTSHQILHMQKLLSIVGDYSYSIYLFHFPLIVLIGYRRFDGNPIGLNISEIIFLFLPCLTFFVWISRNYVEFSLGRSVGFSRILILFWALALLIVSLNVFSVRYANLGFSEKEINVSMASRDRGPFRCGLIARVTLLSSRSDFCLISSENRGSTNILFAGDSHANSIKEALVAALPGRNVYLLNENEGLSAQSLETYIAALNRKHFDYLILHSRINNIDSEALNILVGVLDGLNTKLIIIGPTPELEFSVPPYLMQFVDTTKTSDEVYLSGFTLEDYNLEYQKELNNYRRLDQFGKLTFIDIGPVYCTPRCQIANLNDLKPFYFDYGHLTLTGAMHMMNHLRTELRSIK